MVLFIPLIIFAVLVLIVLWGFSVDPRKWHRRDTKAFWKFVKEEKGENGKADSLS